MIGWVEIGVCPSPIGAGQIAFFDVGTQKKIVTWKSSVKMRIRCM